MLHTYFNATKDTQSQTPMELGKPEIRPLAILVKTTANVLKTMQN
jgi:hypothetical protein